MADDLSIVCARCQGHCFGDYVRALDKYWHPEHFQCKGCEQSLSGMPFFEHKTHTFCNECYMKECAPKCNCCDEPIMGDVTTALGKTWNADHFVCTHCSMAFDSSEGFLVKDDKPYCKPDYYDLFKPKCAKCEKPILDKTLTALGKKWHTSCFACTTCGDRFAEGRFYVFEDLTYCAEHHEEAMKKAREPAPEPAPEPVPKPIEKLAPVPVPAPKAPAPRTPLEERASQSPVPPVDLYDFPPVDPDVLYDNPAGSRAASSSVEQDENPELLYEAFRPSSVPGGPEALYERFPSSSASDPPPPKPIAKPGEEEPESPYVKFNSCLYSKPKK